MVVHPFFKIPLLKRLLSYLVPVTVANSSGTENKFLEFILYRNQWQLATEDALYSDGTRYQPFRIAFRNIPKQRLVNIKDCLVLGTGLGSIVQILSNKYNCKAHFSLVEYDEKILKWAIENLGTMGISKITPYFANAAAFVKENQSQYDMVCIDIFSGREVPSIFTEREFLQQSKQLLRPGGIWIMNYIVNDTKETIDYIRNVKEVFPNVWIIEKEQNKILIAK